MLTAAIGAIAGLMKMKQGREWGRGLFIACAILSIILAVYKIHHPRNGTSKRELARERANEATLQKTVGEKLGLYLAEKYPGAKTVVMRPLFYSDVDPEAPQEAEQRVVNQQLTGLKDGLGNAIDILAVIHPTAPETMLMNIEEMKRQYKERTGEGKVPDQYYAMDMGYGQDEGDTMSAMDFNAFVKKIPANATMVIVLMDFPSELGKISLWKKKWAIAGIVNTVNAKLVSAMEQGYIAALVTGNPKSGYTKKLPQNMDQRFKRFFLLITPENVQATVEANKELFQ